MWVKFKDKDGYTKLINTDRFDFIVNEGEVTYFSNSEHCYALDVPFEEVERQLGVGKDQR